MVSTAFIDYLPHPLCPPLLTRRGGREKEGASPLLNALYYFPLNSGGLFSRKALIPSVRSAVVCKRK
jgi:hypothetical protein